MSQPRVNTHGAKPVHKVSNRPIEEKDPSDQGGFARLISHAVGSLMEQGSFVSLNAIPRFFTPTIFPMPVTTVSHGQRCQLPCACMIHDHHRQPRIQNNTSTKHQWMGTIQVVLNALHLQGCTNKIHFASIPAGRSRDSQEALPS